jgi:hypothetical protein
LRADPARLLALVGLLLAAATAAALPLAADAALGGALTRSLAAATPPGWPRGRVPVALGYTPGPGSVPPGPTLAAGMRALLRRLGPGSGLPLGPVTLAAALRPLPTTLRMGPGPARPVGRVAVWAVAGLAHTARWGPGRAYGVRPTSDGAVPAGVSRSFAAAWGVHPGDALLLRRAGASPLRLVVVGIYQLPPSLDLGAPGHRPAVVVSFRLLLRRVAHGAASAAGAWPVATMRAVAPLEIGALPPAGVDRVAGALAAMNAAAARRLAGTVLIASPESALTAFVARRTLWLRQLGAAAVPALLAAFGLAFLGGWLASAHDREQLATLLARGLDPRVLAASYLWEVLGFAALATGLGPPLAAWALRGSPTQALAEGWSPCVWAGAVSLAAAVVTLIPVIQAAWSPGRATRGWDGGARPGRGAVAVLLVAAAALALGIAATAGGGGMPAAALFGTAPWDPLAGSLLLALAPAMLLAGIGFGLPGALALPLSRWERLVPTGAWPAVTARRALLRPRPEESIALSLLAVAVGAALFASAAAASYRRTVWDEAEQAVGAPLRLVEELPAACDALVELDGLRCLKDGHEVPAPAPGQSAPAWLPWPAPPDPNRGLPGVARASRIFLLNLPDWPPSSQPARLLLVDPRSYAGVALWPPGADPGALRLLAARPGGLVLVGGDHAVPGSAAGDYAAAFPCLVFAPDCPPRIAATTAGPWPGIAPAGPPLYVGSDLAGPVPDLPPAGVRVTATGFSWRTPLPPSWPLGPLRFEELLRLRPGVRPSAVLRALRRRGVRVLSVETPAAAYRQALRRPPAAGRLALWRIDGAAAAVAVPLLAAWLLALAARRRRVERPLLAALGADPRGLAAAAAMEAAARLGAAGAVGGIAATVAARAAAARIAAMTRQPPTVLPASVGAHPWLPLWCALGAVVAWLACSWWGARAGVPAGASPRPVGVAPAPAGPGFVPARGGRRGAQRGHIAAAARARVLARLVALRWLVAASWRGGPPRVWAAAAAFALAAGVGATVAAAAHSALETMLQASLTPENGRPAGAVLLLQNAGATGAVVQPGAPARLARAAASVAAASGLPATPTVTVTQSGFIPVYADQGGHPAAGPPLGMLQLDAQPGLGAHVRWDFGGPPAAAAAVGVLQGAVTQATLQSLGLVPGGRYFLEPAPGQGPPLLELEIRGVFSPLPGAGFWPFNSLTGDVFVNPEALAQLAQQDPRMISLIAAYRVLAVQDLTPAGAPRAAAALQRVETTLDLPAAALLAASPLGELDTYLAQAARLQRVLWLLAAPALAAALLFAALAAAALWRAAEGAAVALQARGRPWAAFLAAGGGLLPLAALAVPVGAGAGGSIVARLGHGAGPPWPLAAWAGSGLAAAAALGASLLLVAHLAASPALAVRAARQARPWRPGLPAAVSALAALAAAAVAWRGDGGAWLLAAARSSWVSLLLPLACVLVFGLTLFALLFAGSAWVARRLGRGGPLGPLLLARRFSRSPRRWAALWWLAMFTVAAWYALGGAGRSVRLAQADAAGLAVGADATLVEGWTTACAPQPPFLPAPAGAASSPYQRYRCFVGSRPWGSSVFAYQLPAPPPAPFAVNRRLPGVRDASRLLERTGAVAVPGGTPQAAEVVGVDPGTYPAAAWWRAEINPMPLSAYMAGVARGLVYASAGWIQAHDLRPGDVLDLTLDGRTLPETLGGAVRVWPGVDAQGVLLVGDALRWRRAFSLKPFDYVALLRLAPGANPARLAPALQAHGLFVLNASYRQGALDAARGAPAAAAVAAVLMAAPTVLAVVGGLGFLLLLRLRDSGPGDEALLWSLGIEGQELARLARWETAMLGIAGLGGGWLAGLCTAGLMAPLLGAVWGTLGGNAPPIGAASLPPPAGMAPFVATGPGALALTSCCAVGLACVGWGMVEAARRARRWAQAGATQEWVP